MNWHRSGDQRRYVACPLAVKTCSAGPTASHRTRQCRIRTIGYRHDTAQVRRLRRQAQSCRQTTTPTGVAAGDRVGPLRLTPTPGTSSSHLRLLGRQPGGGRAWEPLAGGERPGRLRSASRPPACASSPQPSRGRVSIAPTSATSAAGPGGRPDRPNDARRRVGARRHGRLRAGDHTGSAAAQTFVERRGGRPSLVSIRLASNAPLGVPVDERLPQHAKRLTLLATSATMCATIDRTGTTRHSRAPGRRSSPRFATHRAWSSNACTTAPSIMCWLSPLPRLAPRSQPVPPLDYLEAKERLIASHVGSSAPGRRSRPRHSDNSRGLPGLGPRAPLTGRRDRRACPFAPCPPLELTASRPISLPSTRPTHAFPSESSSSGRRPRRPLLALAAPTRSHAG